MKLITKAIEKSTPVLYGTEDVDIADKRVTAKFFTPWSNWTWYMTEYDPIERLAFGYVAGPEHEWGYFSINELESVKGPWGLKIERDIHFTPKRFADLNLN
jgi:hypothetical protein